MAAVALTPAELAAAGVAEKYAIVAPTKRPALTADQVALHKAMHASFQPAHGADAKLKAFLDEACVMRYLWAHQFDEAKARKNLEVCSRVVARRGGCPRGAPHARYRPHATARPPRPFPVHDSRLLSLPLLLLQETVAWRKEYMADDMYCGE